MINHAVFNEKPEAIAYMPLADGKADILDALLKYMNAGSDAEREEAINEIKENITAMGTATAAFT